MMLTQWVCSAVQWVLFLSFTQMPILLSEWVISLIYWSFLNSNAIKHCWKNFPFLTSVCLFLGSYICYEKKCVEWHSFPNFEVEGQECLTLGMCHVFSSQGYLFPRNFYYTSFCFSNDFYRGNARYGISISLSLSLSLICMLYPFFISEVVHAFAKEEVCYTLLFVLRAPSCSYLFINHGRLLLWEIWIAT